MKSGPLAVATKLLTVAALMVGAIFMYNHIPTRSQSNAPLVVEGEASTTVKGRNNSVTVHRSFMAPTIVNNAGRTDDRLTQTGTARWIVLDLTYVTLWRPQDYELSLHVDGQTTGERGRYMNLRNAAPFNQPGIPQHVTAIFEVPAPPHELALIVTSSPGIKLVDIDNETVGPDSQLDVSIPLRTLVAKDAIELRDFNLPT